MPHLSNRVHASAARPLPEQFHPSPLHSLTAGYLAWLLAEVSLVGAELVLGAEIGALPRAIVLSTVIVSFQAQCRSECRSRVWSGHLLPLSVAAFQLLVPALRHSLVWPLCVVGWLAAPTLMQLSQPSRRLSGWVAAYALVQRWLQHVTQLERLQPPAWGWLYAGAARWLEWMRQRCARHINRLRNINRLRDQLQGLAPMP